MLSSQEFLNDQAETLSRVQRYCAATSMSVPVEPYVFSYDSRRQLLVCRNHKVATKQTIQCNVSIMRVALLQVASFTLMEIFRVHLSGLPQDM